MALAILLGTLLGTVIDGPAGTALKIRHSATDVAQLAERFRAIRSNHCNPLDQQGSRMNSSQCQFPSFLLDPIFTVWIVCDALGLGNWVSPVENVPLLDCLVFFKKNIYIKMRRG
jgi:hypothetical protein